MFDPKHLTHLAQIQLNALDLFSRSGNLALSSLQSLSDAGFDTLKQHLEAIETHHEKRCETR